MSKQGYNIDRGGSRLWGLLGRLRVVLGEVTGVSWAVLGRIWEALGVSRGVLGASWPFAFPSLWDAKVSNLFFVAYATPK